MKSKPTGTKDDFQSVLHSLSTLMFINIISSHLMECSHLVMSYMRQNNLVPRVFVPLDQRSETRALGKYLVYPLS